jgi:putative oxidoreductase
MKKLITLNFVPFLPDCGLLLLRAWFGLSIFMIHGLAKLQNFGATVATFRDKMGFPAPLGAAAVLAESVFAILLVLGFATRISATFLAVTMAVAFFKVHGAVLQQGNPGSGEMAFLYLGAFLAILVAGPGRHSVDEKLLK